MTVPSSWWIQFVVKPKLAFQLLVAPLLLSFAYDRILSHQRASNPFAFCFRLQVSSPESESESMRYAKSYTDLAFIAYHFIFWCFIRQIVVHTLSPQVSRYSFGTRRQSARRLTRFGEQLYGTLYWGVMSVWGYRIFTQLPTYWYKTEHFWLGYPHWEMSGSLKRYYLTQLSYFLQQLIVLLLKLERPRTDHRWYVLHHFVAVWLVGWSYLVNLTRIGNAVFLSMDIPDVFLSLSLMLVYLKFDKLKILTLGILVCTWTYFRLFLNVRMLHSVWSEFDLIPESAQQWNPPEGAWMEWWMKYQIFLPLFLLLLLNIMWYFLLLRVVYRAITKPLREVTDERSSDEDEHED